MGVRKEKCNCGVWRGKVLLSGMDGGEGGMGIDRRKECGISNLFVSYQVTTVFVKGSPLEFVICGGHLPPPISLSESV